MMADYQDSLSMLYEIVALDEIVSTGSLYDLLNKLINSLPKLLDVTDCSIFLAPDLISNHDSKPISDDIRKTIAGNDSEAILYLVATSCVNLQEQINNPFYNESGSLILVDHVQYPNIKTKIDKVSNSNDTTNIDFYHDSSGFDEQTLICTLKTQKRSLGIIQYFFSKKTPFSEPKLLDFVKLINMFIANAIQTLSEARNHSNAFVDLIETSSRRSFEDVSIETTKDLLALLQCEKCQIYRFSDYKNKYMSLYVENGSLCKTDIVIPRGKGFIGWVYQTGKPLCIEDIRLFQQEQCLSDDQLNNISDGIEINDDDRNLRYDEIEIAINPTNPASFLAVPIKQDGEVLGILALQAKYGNSFRRGAYFTKHDFELVKAFAKNLSNTIEYEQEYQLSSLLVELGNTTDLQKLYALVIERIPNLVSSAGCSIFEYIKYSIDARFPHLSLITTSRKGFQRESDIQKITYSLDEGKTGFCGLTKASLVINHYGTGDVSDKAMDTEISRIRRDCKNVLVGRLLDQNGIQVGIIHLQRSGELNGFAKGKFLDFCQTQSITKLGLPSKKIEKLYNNDLEPSWSYTAIPIQSPSELYGVIAISRPVPQNPFSSHDITVIESIAGRLATVIGNIKLQEQKADLFMSLAHEINTPITGILADSENLVEELQKQPEIQKIAKNNLVSVLRLHLLTETIMGVLSSQIQYRDFTFCKLGNLIKTACGLFSAEAAFKGCDIQEPQFVDGNFPEIEMAEFDMLIAIKNIIHNAVKYSFSSPNNQEKRYVKIWGSFTDVTKMFCKLNIQNFGVGISKDEIDSRIIFESYYRGSKANDRRRTGAGFGLAHARRIIEDMHGGRIEVTSILQYGNAHLTTFSVILPVRQEYRELFKGGKNEQQNTLGRR